MNAYEVAIKLRLVDEASRGFALMARGIGEADKATKLLQDRLKGLALAGAAIGGAGFAGLRALLAPLEEAKKLQSEIVKFAALGLGDQATKTAVNFAKGMDVLGQSAADNVKLIREAVAITGDLKHAMDVVPQLARMKSAIGAYMGEEKGAGVERMVMDLLKVAELRGALKDPETFKRTVNFATKGYIASGGLVTPRDMLGAIKTGGVAAKSMSDEAFFFESLHMMQEMGGQRFGTSFMSAYQNLLQGRNTVRSAKVLQEMGLLDSKKIEYTTTGALKQVKPGALLDSFKFMQSQFEYFEQDIKPKLAGLTKEGALQKIGSMFSNRTSANLYSTFFLEEGNIKKTAELAKQAMGIDELYNSEALTLQQQENDLHAKWRDLLAELGTTVLPTAIESLKWLNAELRGATVWVRENGALAGALVKSFAALSGVLAIAGTVTALTAAFGLLGTTLRSLLGIAGLSSGAGGAAGGGAVGKVLRTGMAGAVGYELGTVINDNFLSGTKYGDAIGSTVAHILAAFGNKDAREAVSIMSGSSVVPPASSGRPIEITNVVHLDGKQVARSVNRVNGKDANRPPTANGFFDGQVGLTPVGLGWQR